MAERRSLVGALAGGSLSPDKLAFIGGAEKRPEPPEVVVDLSPPEPPVDTEPKSPPKRQRTGPRDGQKQGAGEAVADRSRWIGQLLVPLTTRLRPSTAEALRRACLEQRLQGQRPASQQEIIEEATSSWLRRNGFLD